MRSIKSLVKRKYERMNRKGVLGMDTVRDVIVFLLTLAVITIAVILALVSLRDSSIFAAGSLEQNQTNFIVSNITGGAVSFFNSIPTVFVILAAVVIVLSVTLIIFAVNRFAQGSGSGSI